MAQIISPHVRPGGKVIEVDFDDGTAAHLQRLSIPLPLQLGFGDRCQVRLSGESGPTLVCEVERASGPLRVWTPLAPGSGDPPTDLLVDGQPMSRQTQDIRPGSRIEVMERGTGRRYLLVVKPRAWSVRPRFLAAMLVVVTLAGSLYGLYLQRTLDDAGEELVAAKERIKHAQQAVEQAHRLLDEVQSDLHGVHGEVAGTMRDLRELQAAPEDSLRAEFDLQIQHLAEQARARLALSDDRDAKAREHLRAEVETDCREQVAALRGEFTDRMVLSYQELKRTEERIVGTLSARLAATEPANTHFKAVLVQASKAVVFVHTSFDVSFTAAGEVRRQHAFGTGFLVSDSGLGLTARHVIRPWEYDEQLQVLSELGLAEVDLESAVWRVWTYGQAVQDDHSASGESKPRNDTAWATGQNERGLKLLHVPEVEHRVALVEAPVGVVPVGVAPPGETDSAVFQILDFSQPWPALAIVDATDTVEPLDDVLVVGYPLSRLSDRRAVPQGVSGLVRRDVGQFLELDVGLSGGISGGPVLARHGRVIGMAVGKADSASYGLALRGVALRARMAAATQEVAAEEARLRNSGCDPGPVDDVFDDATWAVYRCAGE